MCGRKDDEGNAYRGSESGSEAETLARVAVAVAMA